MSQIDDAQGAIKISEISADSRLDIINAPDRTDMLSVVERLRRVASDALFNAGLIVLSDGPIGWNAGNLSIGSNGKIIVRAIGAPVEFANSTISIEFQADGLGSNWSIGPNEIIGVELSRSQIESNSVVTLTDGINAAGTAGRRIVRVTDTTTPPCQDPNDGSPEGTIFIPLCMRPYASTNLWWCLQGIKWTNATLSYLGQSVTENTIPVGGIIGFHLPDAAPSGTESGTVNQSMIDIVAPGWWLCDGSVITSPSSPISGSSTPNLVDKFVRGHTLSNQTSGSNSVTLTSSNLPTHAHSSQTADHAHSVFANFTPMNGGDSGGSKNNQPRLGKNSLNITLRTDALADEIHTHTVNGTTSYSSGGSPVAVSGAPHENQPQWYKVVFLMRVV